ncbi:MAG: hypothetical protein CMC13_15505 [Flavobacteriaceae bacterium]|nr:hypothetical protein [Flavobacteriaceae bacterium]|tara:strand:+ start:2530 stop:2832 length:303 start_codon:yes stop_codon:yes gene_type:complete
MKQITFLLFVAILSSACTTTKNKISEDNIMGTIVYTNESNECAYTIKVGADQETVYYDPINLEEKFMVNGLKVQFQYRALKMKNRCAKANPVSLSMIKKQ